MVTLPDIADRLGPFVVASQTATDTATDEAGRSQWRRDYILEVESVGRLTLPALAVGFREQADQAASARQLQTEPLEITVTSVLPADVDITQPKDIAPPIELPPAASPWLPWLVAGALLGLCVLAALFWWRRRRRSGSAGQELRPAHLVALAELERLERDLPAGRSSSKSSMSASPTSSDVTWTGASGSAPRHQTTDELLAAADRTGGPIAARQQLIGGVLAQCDLVKFAREQPSPAAAPGNLHQARTFVKQTADRQARGSP